ncbi:phenylacetic acid degradation protein PaaD [Candidatus Geothermarchaeota archaeon ex4572_27]|nr:MAG: phenylacetic acid degradation protein PaaD [Candidatus Geothermarchaeota archaeon ex4572_27]
MSGDGELKRLFDKFSQDPYCRLLGIRLLELKRGYSKVALRVTEDMLNFHGVAHGGLILSVADAAFAAASNSHNRVAIALNININYRRPVRAGEELVAEAFEESLGRTTALYRVVVRDSAGNVVAICEGLAYRRDEPVVS